MASGPESPGRAYQRPQRKRARTTRAIESAQMERNMEWADESSEGVVDGGKATKDVGSRTAGALLAAFDELRTTLEAKFNKKMEQVKAEVQEMIGGFNETTAGMKDEIRQLREEL